MMRPHRPFSEDSGVHHHGLKLYTIRIKGHLGETSLAAFPEMVVQQRGGDTVLTCVLVDNCALFGVLDQIEVLGLELIELRRLVPKPESSETRDAP